MASDWRTTTNLKDMPIWSIVLGVLGCIFFLGMMVFFVWSWDNSQTITKILVSEGKVAIGTITEITDGHKRSMWAKYHFEIDGHLYEEEYVFYMSMDMRVGDRFEVVYWPKDPTVCRLDFKKPVYAPVVKEKFNLEELDSLAMDSILRKWP